MSADSLEDLILAAVAGQSLAWHVAIPGKVVTYRGGDFPTVDVRPSVRRAKPGPEDEALEYESLPVLPSVPVVLPGGGGFALDIPLQAGDPVVVLCLDTDATGFFRSGDTSDPGDLRRFSLAHAVAIPGVRYRGQATPTMRVRGTSSALEVGDNAYQAAMAEAVHLFVKALSTAFKLAPVASTPQTGATIGAVIDGVLSSLLAVVGPARDTALLGAGPGPFGTNKLKVGS